MVTVAGEAARPPTTGTTAAGLVLVSVTTTGWPPARTIVEPVTDCDGPAGPSEPT